MNLLAPIAGACLIASMPASAAAQQPSGTQSDSQAELAEARAILEIMLPPPQRQKMFDDMLGSLNAQYQQGLIADSVKDPGLKAIISESLDKSLASQKPLLQKHIPAMLDAMALAYSNEFSLAELKEIHAFAMTPSGGHYLSRSTAIIGDPAVAKVNSAIIADSQELALAVRDELKAKIAAYLEAHPEVNEEGEDEAD
jgi:hypothetical protein